MPEEWREIAGYIGYYQVSSMGRIRSMDRCVCGPKGPRNVKGKALKLGYGHRGYLKVNLSKADVRKNYRIARLVASAFIPNPDNLPQIDHINGKRTDNRAVNLQWVTCQENCERASAKYYWFISPAGEFMEIYNIRKFCRDNSLDHSSMYRVHLGTSTCTKGWKAASETQIKEQCA